MPTQSVTLNIPEALYEQLKERAERAKRSVEEETLEVLATAIPGNGTLPAELTEATESLNALDDAGLWEAAQRRLPAEASAELEALHQKRQSEGLADTELQRLDALVGEYERHLLVRAQAIALLKQRGHDVGELIRS
jgi:plasmid stability protein